MWLYFIFWTISDFIYSTFSLLYSFLFYFYFYILYASEWRCVCLPFLFPFPFLPKHKYLHNFRYSMRKFISWMIWLFVPFLPTPPLPFIFFDRLFMCFDTHILLHAFPSCLSFFYAWYLWESVWLTVSRSISLALVFIMRKNKKTNKYFCVIQIPVDW